MKLFWQLSSKSIKLRNEQVILAKASKLSDKFILVYPSHLLIISLGKIIYDQVMIESYLSFESLLDPGTLDQNEGKVEYSFEEVFARCNQINCPRIIDR
jgi:hypothetical protein